MGDTPLTRGVRNTLERPENWELALTRLRVVDAQEDRSLMGVPLSDGDEPYIVMYGFRSRFGRSNSTEVFVNEYADSGWSGRLRTGQQAAIPVGMGTLRFERVESDEVIGAIVVVFESDRTPWAVMRSRVTEVQEIVQLNVAHSVEDRRNPDLESTLFVDELHQSLHDAVVPLAKPLTPGQALESIVFSGVDTDELIGANSIILMRRQPSQSLGYPHYRPPHLTDVLTERDFDIGTNPLVFRNATLGAQYDVELKVRQF